MLEAESAAEACPIVRERPLPVAEEGRRGRTGCSRRMAGKTAQRSLNKRRLQALNMQRCTCKAVAECRGQHSLGLGFEVHFCAINDAFKTGSKREFQLVS